MQQSTSLGGTAAKSTQFQAEKNLHELGSGAATQFCCTISCSSCCIFCIMTLFIPCGKIAKYFYPHRCHYRSVCCNGGHYQPLFSLVRPLLFCCVTPALRLITSYREGSAPMTEKTVLAQQQRMQSFAVDPSATTSVAYQQQGGGAAVFQAPFTQYQLSAAYD